MVRRLFLHALIVSSSSFLLAIEREVAYTLQVADDTSQIVEILRSAHRALMQVVLVNVTTIIAERVGNVEGEIVASLLCCHTQELTILGLAQMLIKIHVECITTREVLNKATTMKAELFNDICIRIFHHVEVRIVAFTRHELAVFAIPTGVLYAYILGRNHFAVEHQVL